MIQYVCDRCRSVMPNGAKSARVHLETIIGEGMPLPERFEPTASRMYNLELCGDCYGELKAWVAAVPQVLVRG